MMMKLTFVALLTVAVLSGLLATPRASYADGPVVKVTQVDPSAFPRVTVYVSVTDVAGQPVGALKQEDFDLKEDGEPVEIVEFAGVGSDRPVDIVFVFDTTGSMADKIEGVKDISIDFANKLAASNRDYRLGLVAFGDEIRSMNNSDGSLTDDADEFKRWVGQLYAEGGDDEPEIALDAMLKATEMTFRPGTQKVLLLITDAPPHVRGDGTPYSKAVSEEVDKQLKDNGFTVYAAAYDDPIFRQTVNQTGGEFYDINRDPDFTGIIDKIGGLIASQYRIAYESNRPAYDGTRRPVAVTVGGSTGEIEYAEEHMLNVQSNPVVAVILVVPLVAALLVPVVSKRTKRVKGPVVPPAGAVAPPAGQPYPPQPGGPGYAPYAPPAGPNYPPAAGPGYSPQAGPGYPPISQPPPAAPPPPSADTAPCARCGKPVRIGAKFCAVCGQPVSANPASAQPAPCPRCGQPLRPGARFCTHCGAKFS